MKRIFTTIAALTMLVFASNAYAEIKFGISAAYTKIDATGSETENTEKTTKEVSNQVIIPSIFVEYGLTDRFSLGLDYIPIKADISDKTHSRTDIETSVSGNALTTATSRVQKAEASIKNATTLYGTFDIGAMYLKAGLAYFDLQTGDQLATGAKYANVDVYGGVVGLGFKQDKMRVELLYTDYEDIGISSSVARTGITANNQIKADLDTLGMKLSYVF